MEHVRALVGFGPRPSGSEALARAGDYIVQQIRALGLTPEEDRWTEAGVGFRNIWTRIPGSDPAGRILAIGTHYDTKKTQGHPVPEQNFHFVGAIDGGGGSGLLLELARVLKERETAPAGSHPEIWLIWFDGEESIPFDWGDGSRALFGSRRFVVAMTADKEQFPNGLASRMKAFVLLDLIGSADIKIDRDGNSNVDLQDIFARTAELMGESQRVYLYHSTITGDDHLAFRDYSVPSVDLIDFMHRIPGRDLPAGVEYRQWWHTSQDDLDNMSAESLQFAGNLVWNALPLIEEEFFK